MRKNLLALLILFILGTAIAFAVTRDNEAGAGEDSSSEIVGPAVKSSRSSGHEDGTKPEVGSRLDLSLLRRSGLHKARSSSLLEPKSWYTPPPPPPTPASVLPPPPPSAPTLPFTYIGRMVDRGDVTLFLSKNDIQYVVRVHDVIDDTYRVENIGEREAILTYTPLNTQQTLQFGSATGESPSLTAQATQSTVPAADQSSPNPNLPKK